jgi:hypothetical protein
MTTEIKIARPDDDVLSNIEKWLRESVGPGSFRTIKNGFMGSDDWFYYNELTDDEDDEDFWDVVDAEDIPENLIFVFRRDTDATVFALKWTTQTA